MTVVHVGYMRRYAPAFLEAKELVAGLGETISFARVQDIIGRNPQIIEDTSVAVRGPDILKAAREELAARESASFKEAIGTDEGDLVRSYGLLLGLSHDISAMRELLGRPKKVLHATARGEGRVITAVFDYGNYVCEFATAVDGIAKVPGARRMNPGDAIGLSADPANLHAFGPDGQRLRAAA